MYGLKVQPRVSFQKFLLNSFLGISLLAAITVQGQDVFIPQQVYFKGLKRTKKSIVQRELAFSSGRALLVEDTTLFFKKSTQNIFNTRLFNLCRYQLDSSWTDSCGRKLGNLVFEVNERWYTFPIPIFELADRNFNEWIYDRGGDLRRVNYGLRFTQHNMRGRNEDLVVTLQGGFTNRVDFSYFFPYLNKNQTSGLKIYSSFSNNRDVAVRSVGNKLVFKRDEESFGRERFSGGFQFSKRNGIYTYHNFDLAYFFNRISAFIYEQNPGYFLGPDFQRYGELKYAFVSDKRNFRYFATKGRYLALTGYRMGLLPTDNFSLWGIRGSFSVYQALPARFFYAGKIDGEWSTEKQQPYLGTRVLGFENRFVRGYERYVLEGSRHFHMRNSLRWRAYSRTFGLKKLPLRQFQIMPIDIYLTALADAGFVHNAFVFEENKRLINKPLAGFGFGLNVVTFYDVVFRAEYSRNIHGDTGIYFSFLTDI